MCAKYIPSRSLNPTDQWIDRVEKEILRQPRKLGNKEKVNKYPQKEETTSWSQWSVLNPPDRQVVMNTIKPDTAPFFKITGNRNHFYTATKQELVVGAIEKEKGKVVAKATNFPISVNGEYGFQWNLSQ